MSRMDDFVMLCYYLGSTGFPVAMIAVIWWSARRIRR